MILRYTTIICSLGAALLLSACGSDAPTSSVSTPATTETAVAESSAADNPMARFFITDDEARQKLRASAHCVSLLSDWQDNGEPVSIAARIGGRADPFVNGHAVMLVSTADAGDACASCRSCDSGDFTALVQLSDEQRVPLSQGLRGTYGLASGTDVLIHGHIISMDGGRPVIDASALAVLP